MTSSPVNRKSSKPAAFEHLSLPLIHSGHWLEYWQKADWEDDIQWDGLFLLRVQVAWTIMSDLYVKMSPSVMLMSSHTSFIYGNRIQMESKRNPTLALHGSILQQPKPAIWWQLFALNSWEQSVIIYYLMLRIYAATLVVNAYKVHSQCVTNIEVSQAFFSWSNVGRLRFDQHLVKWLTFDQHMTYFFLCSQIWVVRPTFC